MRVTLRMSDMKNAAASSCTHLTRLGDVVENINDFFDRASTESIRYVAGEHIDEGDMRVRRYGLTSDDLVPPTFNRLFKAGDVLFHSRNIKKIVQPQFDGLTGEKLFVLRTKNEERLRQDFLPILLQSSNFGRYVQERWAGSTNKFLNKTPLMAYEFALPSFEEQSQIVASLSPVLEMGEALRAARIAAVSTYERMTLEFFAPNKDKYHDSDPTSVFPADWKTFSFESACVQDAPICYGIVQVQDHVVDGIPTVAIKDLDGDFGPALHRTSPSIEAGYVRSRIFGGDLLISVKAVIGAVALVPKGFSGNISRDLARIRLDPRLANGQFCVHLIRSKAFRRYLSKYVVGSTRDELSIGTLRNLRIPLPTIEEQIYVAEALQDAVSAIERLDARIEHVAELRKQMVGELL